MSELFDRVLASPRWFAAFKYVVSGTERYAREIVRAKPGDRVLDIGCGMADVLEHLGDVEYTGFDASERYIAKARAKYGTRGRFVRAPLSEEVDFGAFDIVLATGVIHHLPDDAARTLFRLAKRSVTPGGRLVTLDGCRVPHQPRVERLLLAMDRGRHVRTEAEYVALAKTAFADVRARRLTDLLRIPYTHVVMECFSRPACT